MILRNQRDHADVPYPSSAYPEATLYTSGCGPTCVSMAVENLTGRLFSPKKAAALAISCGARESYGTNMSRLLSEVCGTFGLSFETARELPEAEFGKNAVIVNVSGDTASKKGIFSSGGHFILVIGRVGDKYMILDPYLYPGKYRSAARAGWACEKGGIVYAPREALELDSAGRNPPFYLVSRRA